MDITFFWTSWFSNLPSQCGSPPEHRTWIPWRATPDGTAQSHSPRRRYAASPEHHCTHALWIHVGATNAPARTKLSSPAAASLLLTALLVHPSLPATTLNAQEHALMLKKCSFLTTACGCKITALPPCNSSKSGKHISEAHLHSQLCYSIEKPRQTDPSSCLHKISAQDTQLH